MNYLLHALLAGEEPLHRVGGVVGDFFKGPLSAWEERLPRQLLEGLRLHRHIDSYAEHHAAFQASRGRISPARRRYGGILVDLIYDHLLARDWDAGEGGSSLAEFSQTIYGELEAAMDYLPASFTPVFERMRAVDWLCGYARPDGLADTIERMARHRLAPGNPLTGGMAEFEADEPGFAQDFQRFLPDVQASSNALLRGWQDSAAS